MEKKLPGVYANKIDKKIENNDRVYYSNKEERSVDSVKEEPRKIPFELNINQKINRIFSSTNYVYKADVDITLKDKAVTKKVIGKNATHLITLDNELIPIGDILDIDFTKK